MSSEYLRKIDALVAERIMGLVPQVDFGQWDEHEWRCNEDGEIDMFGFEFDHHNGPICVRCGYFYCEDCQDGPAEPCVKAPPRYSSDIAAAWQVVEKMRERATYMAVERHPNYWRAVVYDGNWYFELSEHADAAPLAICLAALRTVGVEVPGGD